MNERADVLVIGGGAVGACAAYYLVRAGLSVTLVEKGELASGCSGANAGLIVPSHSVPMANPRTRRLAFKGLFHPQSPLRIRVRPDFDLLLWLWRFHRSCSAQKMRAGMGALCKLNHASLKLWKDLIKNENLACGFQQKGWLIVYKKEKAFREALEDRELLQSYGIKAEIFDGRKTLDFCPFLLPEISGGVFYPEDAHLDPARFVSALAERLRDLGVTIYPQTEVRSFESTNSKLTVVRTNRGDFRPENVVLAAGAWSSSLAKKIGMNLPLQPAKGYVISTRLPDNFPSFPLYLSEAKVAITPLEDSLRIAGALEFEGMDFKVRKKGVSRILNFSQDYLKQTGSHDILAVSSGLRPCTPDGLPFISRHPELPNLIVATGHGMLGITLAPVTGKLVSQIVRDEAPCVDLNPFRLFRFC
ncbi:MAG: FAD-dependent oxidoreductase [Clostridiales bacterium]|nr:FAD-dependent oxidoreductase [Clostridiales bacterium]